jgi:hypothetical protein
VEELKSIVSNERDMMAYHARQLVEKLPHVFRSKLADIPVGTLPTIDFNATAKSHFGDPYIVIRTGLISKLHIIAECFAATVRLSPGEPPEMNVADAGVSVFRNMMAWLRNDARWLGSSEGSGVDVVSYERRGLVGTLTYHAQDFILGHEYGHILLGHLSTNCEPSPGVSGLQRIVRSRDDEIAADKVGFEFATQSCRSMHNDISMGVLGVALTIQAFRLIEFFAPPSELSTHPSGSDRLSRFYDWLGPERKEMVAGQLDELNDFIDLVGNVGLQKLNELRTSHRTP